MIENKTLRIALQAVTAVAVLVFLLLTGVRLLLTNAFVKLEYSMPGFPEDTYGMTKAQRLEYAPIALDFLLNGANESFLGDLTFEDGTQLYNERELSHMVDVQTLTGKFLNVWYVSIVLLAGLALWAWRGEWWREFLRMLSTAGLFTIVVLGSLILLMALSFDFVFVQFHHLFFEGDSWLFLYSDTLIRLFPERFWMDAFILVGLFTLGSGLGLWLGLRRKMAKTV